MYKLFRSRVMMNRRIVGCQARIFNHMRLYSNQWTITNQSICLYSRTYSHRLFRNCRPLRTFHSQETTIDAVRSLHPMLHQLAETYRQIYSHQSIIVVSREIRKIVPPCHQLSREMTLPKLRRRCGRTRVVGSRLQKSWTQSKSNSKI